MSFKCDKCGAEVSAEKPGAVIFSPPWTADDSNHRMWCEKFHICKDCWVALRWWATGYCEDK